MTRTEDYERIMSQALQALCLTRDYVGEDALPAIAGWEWYDAGRNLEAEIPDDRWANEFRQRVAADKRKRGETVL